MEMISRYCFVDIWLYKRLLFNSCCQEEFITEGNQPSLRTARSIEALWCFKAFCNSAASISNLVLNHLMLGSFSEDFCFHHQGTDALRLNPLSNAPAKTHECQSEGKTRFLLPGQPTIRLALGLLQAGPSAPR